MAFFKTGLTSILRKSEGEKPDADEAANALARHFSPPAERHMPPPLPEPPPPRPAKPPPPKPVARSKLVFAFDATSSRQHAWDTAVPLTDALLAALPDQLDVALAVHGGSKVQVFTPFMSDAGKLRDRAAVVKCKAGNTCLLEILARVIAIRDDVSTVVYIGDTFEESERHGRKYADALKAQGTRLIILHDYRPGTFSNEEGIFAEMAARSGGTILPFEASSLPKLKELLSAIAVLAVGDVAALAAQQETMPAARVLLEGLADSKQLLIGGKGGSR